MGRGYAYIVIVLVAIALTAIALGATPAAVDMCSRLMHNSSLRALPNTTITSAETVSGTFTPPDGGKPIEGLPSFCRVTATIKPSPVSDIKVEVWMPSSGWNGKLEGVGNNGLAGSIMYVQPRATDVYHGALADAIKSGYAGVSTDTGHVTSDRTWLANEEKERDYGYRAIHGMTVDAKAIVQKFYGSSAKHSYFNGCSTGGGQALGEAQLYPKDYDGILAGDSQNILTHARANDIWLTQMVASDPASKPTVASLTLVTKAVLKLCGGDYGAPEDGFLSADPRECWFGPEQLLCKAGQDPATCLTAPQVKLVQKMYEGFIIRTTNQIVMPGFPVGSEGPEGPGTVGWVRSKKLFSAGNIDPADAAAQFYLLGVLQNPNADIRTMDLESALKLADEKFPYINHVSTDLDAFLQGGKLLMYHGWDDPSITVYNSINYYSAVVEALRDKRRLGQAAALAETQKSARLFLVPGMVHCGGGPGPDTFNPLDALDQWVDPGVAPDRVIGAHVTNGATTFSRPLCPYPQEAEYKGSGDRNDAANWVCFIPGRNDKEHWNFEMYDRKVYRRSE